MFFSRKSVAIQNIFSCQPLPMIDFYGLITMFLLMATISPAILLLEIAYNKYYGDPKILDSKIESEDDVDYFFEIRGASAQTTHVILFECRSIVSTHNNLRLEIIT
jgi:hypothetical protein